MNFRKLLKKIIALSTIAAITLAISACSNTKAEEQPSGSGEVASTDPVVIVWFPTESAESDAASREVIGNLVTEVTGREVEQKLTTDYAIAIESLVSGTADLCFMGAQGYLDAHDRNENILPLVTNSGPSGTLDDAKYYAILGVLEENADEYIVDGEYSLSAIEGKKMSFVSNNSTSGFTVPSSAILSYFKKTDDWADIVSDDLLEGGSDMLFSDVMFGGSHQGATINILAGNSDIGAFANSVLGTYMEIVEGDVATPGLVYEVREGAEAPFDSYIGQRVVGISSTPVLNAPVAYNSLNFTDEEIANLIAALTSDEIANNEDIFSTTGEGGFWKKSGDERFVASTDEWYDPIRALSE